MGGLWSSLKNYIARKINCCYENIVSRINGIKNRIKNKIVDTKNSICNYIINTRDSIYFKVRNNKNRIVNAIKHKRNNLVNGVTARYNSIKNAILFVYISIVSFFCNCRDSLVRGVTNCVNKFISTKNYVIEVIQTIKNTIVSKYNNTKNSTKQKYYSIKNAKLTKWQKVKYGFLLTVIVFILSIVFLTLFDIYIEEYDQAEKRLQNIYSVICSICYYCLYYAKIGSIHVYNSCIYIAENIWIALNFLSLHISQYLYIFKTFVHENSKAAILSIGDGIRFVALSFWNLLGLIGCWVTTASAYLAEKTYAGGCIAGEHVVHYSAIGFEHTKYAAKVSAVESWKWSKIGLAYAKEGLSYAYHHGSILAKDLMVNLGRYLIYFLTNTRMATVEGASKIWQGLKVTFAYIVQGTSIGINYSYLFTKWLITTVFIGFCDIMKWSYYAIWDAKLLISNTSKLSFQHLKNFSSNSYEYCCYLSLQTYNAILDVCAITSRKFFSFCDFSYICLLNVKDFIVKFSILAANNLYLLVTNYIVPCFLSICRGCFLFISFLGEIFKKFFTDLVVYVSKFIFVTANRIYLVLYYFIQLIVYFFSVISGSLKFFIVNAEVVVRSLFSAIIYVLQKVGNVYLGVLDKYTSHKEKIFFLFLLIFTIYYTDLIQDDSVSETSTEDIAPAQEVQYNSELEELSRFIENLQTEETDEETNGTKSEDLNSLRLTGVKMMPSYDDVGSSDEDLFEDDDEDLDIDS